MKLSSELFKKLLQHMKLEYNLNQLQLPEEIVFATDTRALKPGEVFVAIKGDQFDGNHFVEQALKQGAAFVICENSSKLDGEVVVHDSVEFLREAAQLKRSTFENVQIFAVAGSNGKTTTKEFLSYLCQLCFGEENVYKTLKSENSVLGLAMNLLRIEDHHQVAILEVGIDEPGWMKKHLELMQPNFGIITTIQEEHLHKLKNIETVANEELQLLYYIVKSNGGFAANLDSEWIRLEEMPKNHLSYSLERRADIEGGFRSPGILSAFGVEWANPLSGKHNAQNLLAALTALRLLKTDLKRTDLEFLSQNIKYFKGEAHRSKYFETGNAVFVYDDCYNANPSSMEAALQTYLELSEGLHRIAVLGEMKELGSSSTASHTRILNLALVSGFEKIFCYGEEFKKAMDLSKSPAESLSYFDSMEELKKAVQESISSYQSYFIKGSRGNRLERLLDLFEIR